MNRFPEPSYVNPSAADLSAERGWEDARALVVRMKAMQAELNRLSDTVDGDRSNAFYDAAYSLENAAADICVAFNIDTPAAAAE